MRETKYNWIEAIRLMLDGKFVRCCQSNLTYRISENTMEWYDPDDDSWTRSSDGDFQSYYFHITDNPQPEYVDCTWQEACALRAFMRDPADEIVIKCNDLSWAVHFGWSPGFKDSGKWKFKMLRKYYNKYFR